MIYFINISLIYDKGYESFTGIVINIVRKEEYNKLIVKKGLFKVIVYDYDFQDINISDKVIVQGINLKINPLRIEYGFDLQKYYYSQRIVSVIKSSSINISKRINIYILRKYIYFYIEDFFDETSSSFIKGMILGDTSALYNETKNNIEINGISHLFAISGLHITLLVSILSKILLLLKVKEKKAENIIVSILIIYLIVTNFAVSIFRASSMYILMILNKRKKGKLSSLDIISIVFILIIFINPLYKDNLSFILSFMAAFSIIIISQTIKEIEKKRSKKYKEVYKLLATTFILQIVSFPIVINLNNSFNILSVITNVVFISFVTILILPITFLVLLLPILNKIYFYIILSFDKLNMIFATYFSFSITLPSFNKYEILIYYLLLITFILCINSSVKKRIISFSMLILFLNIYYNKAYLNYYGEVNFLDLYNGDCTLIDMPFNEGIVLIDTGSNENDDVLKYLKGKGIRTIDYLVITHSHSDHNGQVYNLINEFNVKKIIMNEFDRSEYSKYSYAYVMKATDSFEQGTSKFYVLSPIKDYENENDNSLVLYVQLGDMNYLFLADVGKKVEEDLISYNLDVDIVKVAHHGSSSSTSKKFYYEIKPKVTIIETGRKVMYGFPHKQTIETLKPFKLYRTDLDYSIKIKYKKKSIIKLLK